MYRISLAPSTMGDLPEPELIDIAGKAGFDAVTLTLFLPPVWFRRASTIDRPRPPVAEIKTRLADAGLSLLSVNSLFFVPETNPEDFNRLLDDAAALGAPFFQVVIIDPDRPRLTRNFARACELAAARNIRLAIEFKDDSTVATIGDAANLIRATGYANGGICVDAFHLSRSGGSPRDLQPLDPQMICYVELNDAPLQSPPRDQIRNEARTGRRAPGTGGLWLNELLDAAPKNIVLNVECPGVCDPKLSNLENAKMVADATRRFLSLRDTSLAAKRA